VQGIPQLPEVDVEVADLEGGYEGDWDMVIRRVDGINRTNEDDGVVTARVHVMVSNPSVRKIGVIAFCWCMNLVKVTAPFAEEVEERAFKGVLISPT